MPRGAEPYEIRKYSVDGLKAFCDEVAQPTPHCLETKRHIGYLDGYFRTLKARTILAERDYTDRDYLEDYAAYYARCFQSYDRRCMRLHFFSREFARRDFEACLRGDEKTLSPRTLQEAYLGFVVLRPLPRTFVGRTCLAVYPADNGQRHYPATHYYTANLFGIRLCVNSLAFQEQDRAVAACATSALWSAFHQTSELFHHALLPPSAITAEATKRIPCPGRGFPNCGLTEEQMAAAIMAVGLEPHFVDVSDLQVLKSVVYAYTKAGIPAILLMRMAKLSGNRYAAEPKHAVTIAGFRLPTNGPPRAGDFVSRALAMNELYVHDDQMGPFARLELDGKNVLGLGKPTIKTCWPDKDRAIPEKLIVPLYHKIRIPFEAVSRIVEGFGSLLSVTGREVDLPVLCGLEWDIHLETLAAFRAMLLKENALRPEKQIAALIQRLPRFLWYARAWRGNKAVMDLIFDATDINQASLFLGALEYEQFLGQLLRKAFATAYIEKAYGAQPFWQVIQWFRANPV